jgi:hypothetical protein
MHKAKPLTAMGHKKVWDLLGCKVYIGLSFTKTIVNINHLLKCVDPVQENVVFLTQKAIAHDTWGKLCGFIHYNVQYVVFIVTYITLKLQLDIKLWHITVFP